MYKRLNFYFSIFLTLSNRYTNIGTFILLRNIDIPLFSYVHISSINRVFRLFQAKKKNDFPC